jgi:hypothetical protein
MPFTDDAMRVEDTNKEGLVDFDEVVTRYIRSRKEKVQEFVKKYFSVKGALRLNKKAFGADLYKAPLNVAWSMPYIGIRASSFLLKKFGQEKTARRMDGIPPGFQNRVQAAKLTKCKVS